MNKIIQPKRGGARPGAGRPRTGATVERHNVSLPADVWAAAERRGNGNASAGIRRALGCDDSLRRIYDAHPGLRDRVQAAAKECKAAVIAEYGEARLAKHWTTGDDLERPVYLWSEYITPRGVVLTVLDATIAAYRIFAQAGAGSVLED